MDEQSQTQPQIQPQSQLQPQPEPQPQNQPVSKKTGNGKIVVAAVLIILIVAATLIYYFVFNKNLKKATPKPQESQQSTQESDSSQSARPHGPEITNLVMTKIDPQKSSYFIDKKGMSLYIFDKDTPGKSNCSDTCLANWPIFESPEAPPENLEGEIGIIKSTNGKYMYTYKNKPLYYYINDKQPGDTTGDGVGGVWHLAKP